MHLYDPLDVNLGDIVYLPVGLFPFTWGKVVQIVTDDNSRRFMVAHKGSCENSGLYECPDKARCKHEPGCPLHTVVACLDPEWDSPLMKDTDLAFYVSRGMIAKELVPEKPCPKP